MRCASAGTTSHGSEMGLFRRDGRLRPGTLWAFFVVALLAGAAAGWFYRAWTHPTLGDRARNVAEDAQRAVQKLTK